MANARRGEIEAELGGERRVLCLTLGALAELEAAYGAEDLAALAGRFQSGRLAARDVTAILAAGLRGGGADTRPEDVAAMRCEGGLPALVRLAGRLLQATFGGDEEPREGAADPPAPGETQGA